jgi:uncharacterized protein (TIGR03435 family)
MEPGHIEGGKISMTQLTTALTRILGRSVVDQTGYKGTFDIHLEFTPEVNPVGSVGVQSGDNGASAAVTPGDTSGPSIFTALEEKLGLRLESQKTSGQILVVDHAEKASEN